MTETADHVLIKGWHDTGTIDAVYGPYTETEARWIYDNFLADNSMNNWTVTKLDRFTAYTAAAEAAEASSTTTPDIPQRDPESTLNATTERTPAHQPRNWRHTTAQPFGFGTQA